MRIKETKQTNNQLQKQTTAPLKNWRQVLKDVAAIKYLLDDLAAKVHRLDNRTDAILKLYAKGINETN